MSIFRGFRYPTAIAFGLFLTASLFWSLWSFTNVTFELQSVRATPVIPIRTIVDTPAEQKFREPDLIEPPPRIEVVERIRITEGTDTVAPPVIDISIDDRIGTPPVLTLRADSDALPIVRVNPDYPERAARGGIEGWVQVRFTVTGTGSVTDVTVVDSSPPNVFDDAAVRAVSRWRYNPKVEGAVAVDRVGVQTLLRFELEEE